MLDKDRQVVLEQIKWKLENDMNNIMDDTGCFVDDNEFYNQQWSQDGAQFSGPNEMIGWPPGLAKYIKRMSLMMAKEILDSILTKEEIDNNVKADLYNVFHYLNVK